jgi:transcriptional regulator with XRE-family HTH domain|nr:MAG TPA: repressor protein [Caudoviricetes sp.]
MTPLERIRLLCKKAGISMTALEEKLEFSNGSISKPKDIPSSRIIKIAEYFGVSTDWILTGEENSAFSDESAHLISKIRNDADLENAIKKILALSDKKKKHVFELIDLLSEE